MKKVANLKKLPSPEIKKRKKSMKIIYAVLVVLILLFAIIAYSIYEKQAFVKRGDKATYRWIKCVSACPTYKDESLNKSLLDPICSNMCSNYLIAFGQENYNRYKTYDNTLLNSTQVKLCADLLSFYDFPVFQECLNQTIPKLEKKYPYVI